MKASALKAVRILIVEDNYMIAASLADALQYAGATVVGVLGNLEQALEFVESRHSDVDVVLLDVNLSGVMSYPIADILERQDVPFVFTTGYDNASINPAYRSFPICMKPFSFDAVVSTIRRIVDNRADFGAVGDRPVQ